MAIKESKFQADLKKEIQDRFPGAVVLKNDPTHNQGFPDLLVLYKKHWGALETKKSATAKLRPNQGVWISKLNDMSFGRFVYPENKQEVLNDLQEAFRT